MNLAKKYKETLMYLEMEYGERFMDNLHYQELRSEIIALESPEQKPTDEDIMNAANELSNKDEYYGCRQATYFSYIRGAKDYRDNKIYIKPKER